MHVTAHLDLDVLAHETDSALSVLLEMAAPAAPVVAAGSRPPGALQVVLDRSGSMQGPPLEGAKQALEHVVDKLDPRDSFGLVVFDDQAVVVVPAAPLRDKAAVKRTIRGVHSGGMTDLAAGYLRGLQEARRAASGAGATLVLISDGYANSGETSPDVLGSVAAKARADGVTTSSLGYGLGYDERLLSALARSGGGNENFAENPDEAGRVIIGEAAGMLEQAAQAASVFVAMSPAVSGVRVVNDLPSHAVDGGVQVELGGFYAGETRKVVLTFDVPALSTLGLAEVATLTLRYVELPALVEHTVTVPIHVNVVPGDDAAGRVPDAVVRSELAYQEAQRLKREAATALSEGRAAAAVRMLASASSTIAGAMPSAPAAVRADLGDEAAALDALIAEVRLGQVQRAAKAASSDAAYKSRTRGRTRSGDR